MKFCSHCGTEIKDQSRNFCANCGQQTIKIHNTTQTETTNQHTVTTHDTPTKQGMSGGAKFFITIIIIVLISIGLYSAGVFDDLLNRNKGPGLEIDDDGFRFRDDDGKEYDFKW